MRILFLSKADAGKGGVERWLSDLATGLARRGEVCIVGFAQGRRFHDPAMCSVANASISTMEVIHVDGVTGVPWARRRQLELLIEDVEPDIIVPVLLHEGLGAASARRKAGQQFKLVYPIHESEVWVFQAIKEYSDCIDATVSVNQLMRDALSQFAGWPDERNFHIRCGVEDVTTQPSLLAMDTLEIGYCGKLSEGQKRASDLVEFCRVMERRGKKYRLSIAGSGPSEQLLREKLNDRVAMGQVRFLGWLSDADLYGAFYPSLDVLLVTSEWETGPLVAWEAMMHGVLVLTSEYRGLRREGVLRDGETALVYPIGGMDEAARKICELSEDSESFRCIGEIGMKYALQNLGIERMLEQWNTTFEDVLKLPDKQPRQGMHYDPPSGRIEWVEHYARKVLNRPIHHANSHAEWPRYKPGHVTDAERMRFVEDLDKLEASMVGRGTNVTQAAECEKGV